MTGPNPSGLCLCGCGQRTNLATESSTRDGWVKGQPHRFIRGHQGRFNRKYVPGFVVDMATGCHNWTGRLNDRGYGVVAKPRKGQYHTCQAHRLAYIEAYGPIPEGLELHHKCHNRACVRPDHLLALTHAEHMTLHRTTHCVHGHEYTPENTLHGSQGFRLCVACRDARRPAMNAKRRAARRALRLTDNEEAAA